MHAWYILEELKCSGSYWEANWCMGNWKPHLFSLFITKASSRCYSFPFWRYWCHTLTSFLRPRIVIEVSIWACGAGVQETPVCSQGDSSRDFFHCFVTIALDWLEWRKNYCEARYSFKFSPEHRVRPRAYSSTQLHFPLGGCLATGTWEALACAVESDGIEGEGGFRQEADSPVPWIITLESPNASKPRLPMPLSEKWATVCNFLASSFPSLCPIQCQNKPDRFQGSWNWDEKSKQGLSLSTISIRQWGKEGGRKEESLTADVQSCVLKSL